MKKIPIFDQNQTLTPLENSEFFDFLNFLFLWSKRAFFLSRIFWNTFAYNKKMETLPIFDQNHGLAPLKQSQYFDSFNFLFL